MVTPVSARYLGTIEPLEPRIAPATIVVSSAADSGPGTLRQAILDANKTGETDLIRIENIDTISLISGLPKITQPIVLEGNEATLDGTDIVGTADGIVLENSGSESEIDSLRVTHFPGNGFVLGDFLFSHIVNCSAVENGRGTNGVGFWVRSDYAVLQGIKAIGNSGSGILFQDRYSLSIQGCLVDGAYTRDNGGPEVHIAELDRSWIINSTFYHGDEAAIAVDSTVSHRIIFDGDTFVGNSSVPIDLGNNGLSPHDAPSQAMGYTGPDGWEDAPVLTEYKTLGDVSHVSGFARGSYRSEIGFTLYSEQMVDGQIVRSEIDHFTAFSDENGLASFVRILPTGEKTAAVSLRATRSDEYFQSQSSEMSDSIEASRAGPSPLSIVNPRKVVFTDWDGDRITVTTTKGRLDADDFDLVPAGKGYHLAALRLDSTFEGSDVRISAKHSRMGDGRSFVGEIHAEDVNLRSISIRGSLHELTLGRTDESVSLGKLSMEMFGYNDGSVHDLYGGETAIISGGTISRIACGNTVVSAAIISLGGNIGRLDVGYQLQDSLILARNIGSIRAISIDGTTIRAETGSIGRVEALEINKSPNDFRTEIFARTTIGSIVSLGISYADIIANADPTAGFRPSAKAIGSITASSHVTYAKFLAGVPLPPLTPGDEEGVANGSARIGNVHVGGDWIGSDLAAGVDAGSDEQYGTADDSLFAGADSSDKPAIAHLFIRGKWDIGGDGVHAVVARTIGSVKVHGARIPIPTGPFSQTVATSIGWTGEMRLVQLSGATAHAPGEQ